ncbi:MAG TPA: hypothetical protein QGH84_06975 [Rhodospirillales bacterium]|jgi:hypothetical protein|nr:hypothetical protein [Rhodospirillales bacterium]
MIETNKTAFAAKNFFKRFGKDAPAEAKRRAQEMRLFGKAEGYATWMQIFEQVKAMAADEDDTS